MKKLIALFISLLVTTSALAKNKELDLKVFAQMYFDSMVATQVSDATSIELENYLALLTDDIGHSHLPWEKDDSRLPDGKAAMRKGMTFYLGAHTEYKAELLNVFTFNSSAIAIRYKNHAKGVHPQTSKQLNIAK